MTDYNAKEIRAARHDKAKAMAAGEPHIKVDASTWEPTEMLPAGAKTGLRPVSPRQYRHGGHVAGHDAKHHAGRKPRASGGNVANDYSARDVKEANAKFGKPYTGGFARGGHPDVKEDRALIDRMVKPSARTGKASGGVSHLGNCGGGAAELKGDRIARKSGGHVKFETGSNKFPDGEERNERKRGGRTGKGKTNIVIAINPGHGGAQADQAPGSAPMPMPPVMRPAVQPVPVAAGAPPMMPPPGAGGGMPPGLMPRKSGGRAYRSFEDMDAGSGGAKGRLEKVSIQEHNR